MGLLKLLQSALLIVEGKKKKRRRRRRKRGGREKEGEGEGGGGRKKEKRRGGKGGREGEVVDRKCAQFTYCLNVSRMELGSRGKKCQTRMCVNNVLVG